MNNKAYFEFSQEHIDNIVDYTKPEGFIVINKNCHEAETNLMVANHDLIELISAYKILKNDDGVNNKTINSILDKIIYILDSTDSINYSPFCVYFQVVGYSFSSYCNDKNYMTIDEKRELVSQLLNLYIDNRHNIYMYHGYSNMVLQVNSDAASSRRKGKTGIKKMEEILVPLRFVKAKTILDLRFKRFCYILPDKGDLQLFNKFLIENKVKFEFRTTRDNKNPDMLLKINDHYYVLEHKLTNGCGGSQNAEINEIIQFINYEEDNKKWHYISCLQGDFFKKLNARNKEPKAESQYRNIIMNLDSHPQNYFLNGNGFEKFIKDITDQDHISEVFKKLEN